jgi:large subunit ribosomal protein L3
MVQVITVDDREKTPNFGKTRFNPATVLSAPPVTLLRIRAYGEKNGARFIVGDVFPTQIDDRFREAVSLETKRKPNTDFQALESRMKEIVRFSALIVALPSDSGLSNGKPQLQEIEVTGGDSKAQLDYLKGLLGKQIKVSDLLKPGVYVDAIGITKGKGFEGPVTRFGVKRKQHKSRKSVRAVGVISPWHPATVMYTVARAGQMGFHQRIMKNNRILAIGNAQQGPITPGGGYLHFGDLKGDYLIVRGSIPGPAKRLVDLRIPLYPRRQKITAPRVIEVNAMRRPIQIPKAASAPSK